MDREDLLRREDAAWTAFVDAFASVAEARRTDGDVVPGWSVKDLVWHCGFWADYVGDELERIAAGQPAPPDQDWDALNDMVIQDGRPMPWDEVVVAAERGRDRARAALEAMGDLPEQAETDFREETIEHYEEHAAEIAKFAATR